MACITYVFQVKCNRKSVDKCHTQWHLKQAAQTDRQTDKMYVYAMCLCMPLIRIRSVWHTPNWHSMCLPQSVSVCVWQLSVQHGVCVISALAHNLRHVQSKAAICLALRVCVLEYAPVCVCVCVGVCIAGVRVESSKAKAKAKANA